MRLSCGLSGLASGVLSPWLSISHAPVLIQFAFLWMENYRCLNVVKLAFSRSWNEICLLISCLKRHKMVWIVNKWFKCTDQWLFSYVHVKLVHQKNHCCHQWKDHHTAQLTYSNYSQSCSIGCKYLQTDWSRRQQLFYEPRAGDRNWCYLWWGP